MKKLIPIFILSLFVATLSAQEQKHVICISLSSGETVKYDVSGIERMWFEKIASVPTFPVKDNSKVLDVTTPAHSVHDLLLVAGPECTDTLGRAVIEDYEYAEIKAFTDNLVQGLEKQYDIYVKCYDWVRTNVKYANQYDDGSYVNNDPYPVFQTKKGVCQGYANLLFIMLHSQGVPAMLVNGWLSPGGGHAWNYVNCDGTWYVSDPTNSQHFEMSNISQYTTGYYNWLPTSMDVVLFKENNFWYNFTESRLNVCQINSESEVLVVPYSTNGMKISLLNPTSVSSNVKELYVGENIESFADFANGMVVGLRVNAPGLEAINIDPDNQYFMSHKGVVYSKDAKTVIIIPAAIKRLELLPVDFGKDNSIENLKEVEEIVFPEGISEIGMYAVSDCRKLKVAYIPKSTNVHSMAFYNVHKDFKIVRY